MKIMIGFVLLLALIGTASYLYLTRVERVEKILSENLQAEVSVKDVKLGWNRIILENLKVCEGDVELFQAETIDVGIAFWSLLKDEVVIESLRLKGPKVSFEAMTLAMARVFSSDESRVSIERLSVEGLTMDGREIKDVEVPYFELVDLRELTKSQVCERIFSRAMQKLPKSVLKKEGVNLKAVFDESMEVLKRKTEEAKGFLEELFSN